MKRTTLFKSCILLLNLIPLTSCSILSPVETIPMKKYLVSEIPDNLAYKPYHSRSILVLPCESDPIYKTTKMAYSERAYQIDYFNYNEWAEPLPVMLHPLIVKTLQNTRSFRAVLTSTKIGDYDYILKTRISEFLQDLTKNPAVFHITLQVQLYSASENKILATKEISQEEPLLKISPYDGVLAANKAFSRALHQMTEFVFHNMK